MIQLTDLRIGNYVRYNGRDFTVCGINSPMPNKDKRFDGKPVLELCDGGIISVPMDEVEGIKIRPSHFKDMWFDVWNTLANKDNYRLIIHGNGTFTVDNVKYYHAQIRYIHELQNSFFYITGEELSWKQS